jgi:hypothetical protein
MIDPTALNNNTQKWQYTYAGKADGKFDTKREAATAYVKHLILKEPKYKPLFLGKSWAEIFKMVGIKL